MPRSLPFPCLLSRIKHITPLWHIFIAELQCEIHHLSPLISPNVTSPSTTPLKCINQPPTFPHQSINPLLLTCQDAGLREEARRPVVVLGVHDEHLVALLHCTTRRCSCGTATHVLSVLVLWVRVQAPLDRLLVLVVVLGVNCGRAGKMQLVNFTSSPLPLEDYIAP